jgi:hypothetical protein
MPGMDQVIDYHQVDDDDQPNQQQGFHVSY